MTTKREKQLATLLLKERLERLTGKRVVLEENIEARRELTKDDFRVKWSKDLDEVYITPIEINEKRNKSLDSSVKTTNQHSFNADLSYYSNGEGTLGIGSPYGIKQDKEELLNKAISYYNWAVGL